MTSASDAGRRTVGHRRLVFLIPVLVFLGIGAFLAIGLTRDPGILPSPLIDKPVPQFDLPPVPGRSEEGLSSGDLGGKPMLVNVFASWCVPCRVEHPILDRLAEDEGVTIQGINYKDRAEDVNAWLSELGNPFDKLGYDRDGRVAIDWGVYGVPETFVIDKNGRIAYKHVGPLQPHDVETTILPLLERLK